jgi:hypothetical protein
MSYTARTTTRTRHDPVDLGHQLDEKGRVSTAYGRDSSGSLNQHTAAYWGASLQRMGVPQSERKNARDTALVLVSIASFAATAIRSVWPSDEPTRDVYVRSTTTLRCALTNQQRMVTPWAFLIFPLPACVVNAGSFSSSPDEIRLGVLFLRAAVDLY